jgi:hypothetical protein
MLTLSVFNYIFVGN